MHSTLEFLSRLPNYAAPYLFQSRLGDYKRANLGISYTFVGEKKKSIKK